MNAPSCSMLELNDFGFKNNTCSGRCGVILSSRNQLRDVRVQQVTAASARTVDAVVFYAPPESVCSIEHMDADENGCPILHVDGGTLNVSGSTFAENDIDGPNGSDDVASCIRLMNATGVFEDSQFRKNRAQRGCAIAASRSNLTISDCAFEENKAKHAGVIHLTASNASIQSCDFSANQARRSAGIMMAVESQIVIVDSSFEANAAGYDGGCFHLQSASTIELIRSTLSGNEAQNGGVAFLGRQSIGRVLSSSFVNNSATSRGGSFRVEDSRLTVHECRFENGTAEHGAGICMNSSRLLVRDTSVSDMHTVKNGGFVDMTSSWTFVQNVALTGNHADNAGGGIAAWNSSRVEAKNLTSFRDKAKVGGVIYMNFGSSGFLIQCRFERNNAVRHGGAIHVVRSTLEVDHSYFLKSRAVWGGMLFAQDSEMNITDSSFDEGSGSYGGCMRLMGRSQGEVRDTIFTACRGRRVGGAVQLNRGSSSNFVNATFIKNSAIYSGGTFHIEQAVANLIRCHFADGGADDQQRYDYGFGGFVFSCCGSRVAVKNSTMEEGIATEDGGCLFARDSILSVDGLTMMRCNASENGGGLMVTDSTEADLKNIDIRSSRAEHGAGIYVEDSTVTGQGWIVIDNDAIRSGGLYMTRSSITLENAHMKNNWARFGGAVLMSENSAGSFLNVTLKRNRAIVSGGSLYVEASRLVIEECRFTSGSAEFGGCFYARDSYLPVQRSILQYCNALQNGGAMNLGSSVVQLETVDVFRNQANAFGGGLYAVNSTINGRRCNLKDNHADEYGGGLYTNSSVTYARESILESNVALNGGGGYLLNSSLVVHDSILQNNSATDGGAMYFPSNTRGDFLNTTFTNNAAARSGGSLYTEQSNASFDECLFQNGAADSGGLLLLWSASNVDISHSTLKDSNATWGGCLNCRGGNLTLHNATVHGCRASASGGAVYSRNTALRLSTSLFEENSATLGGAMDQRMNTTSVLSNVTFANNWARRKGGSLYSDESVLILRHCSLRNSSSEDGGLVFSWEDVLVNITDSDLVRGSAQEGGCVSATKTNLTFWRTSIVNCSASKDGGGLYIKEESNLQLINSTIEGNRAVGSGGGFSCMSDGVVHLEESIVKNNTARSGGAMDVGSNITGSLIHVTFVDNSAATGGDCHLQSSGLRIARSHFSGGDAEKGGGFFVSESTLNISDSEFSTMRASLQGGFIFSEERSSVMIENSSMVSGTSAVAGAVVLISSDFRARHLRISQCEAEGDGGAIWGVNSSRFLCIDCVLRDNSARRGGSVYFEYSDAQTVTVQLIGTAVQNNSATFGGILDQR